jgi:hypothetical protein
MVTARSTELDWAIAARPLLGTGPNGDRDIVIQRADGAAIVVVDGLGHGPEAAEAAAAVVTAVERAATQSIAELVQSCHVAAMGTRGAVMSLATLNTQTGTLAWMGIGNVAGLVVRASIALLKPKEYLAARAGIVGQTLPALTYFEPGDLLVLATDGVRVEWQEHVRLMSASAVAEDLLSRFGKPDDDALVLAAKPTTASPAC